jgi:hypothetical protein
MIQLKFKRHFYAEYFGMPRIISGRSRSRHKRKKDNDEEYLGKVEAVLNDWERRTLSEYEAGIYDIWPQLNAGRGVADWPPDLQQRWHNAAQVVCPDCGCPLDGRHPQNCSH